MARDPSGPPDLWRPVINPMHADQGSLAPATHTDTSGGHADHNDHADHGDAPHMDFHQDHAHVDYKPHADNHFDITHIGPHNDSHGDQKHGDYHADHGHSDEGETEPVGLSGVVAAMERAMLLLEQSLRAELARSHAAHEQELRVLKGRISTLESRLPTQLLVSGTGATRTGLIEGTN